MKVRIGRAARAAFALVLLAAGAASPALAATVITGGADRKVKFWNSSDGSVIKTLDAHDGAVNVAVLSPDGKILATGGADKKVRLWNAADGTQIRSIDAHDGAVTALFFSADGSKLYSGAAGGNIKVWKTADGAEAASFTNHDAAVLGIFAGEGFLVTSSADGKMVIADPNGQVQVSFPTEHAGGLKVNVTNHTRPVTYTGGGEGKIKYWSEAAQGEFAEAQGSAVTAMAVSPDGKKLLTGGADGKVKVWDTDTYKLLATIDTQHRGGVTAIGLSADGRVLITGGGDGSGKAWDATSGELLKEESGAHPGGVTVILYRAD